MSTRLREHAWLSPHRLELGERDAINLFGDVEEEQRANSKWDEKQHEHVRRDSHTVMRKAHVPLRVFEDSRICVGSSFLFLKEISHVLFRLVCQS